MSHKTITCLLKLTVTKLTCEYVFRRFRNGIFNLDGRYRTFNQTNKYLKSKTIVKQLKFRKLKANA